MTTRDNLQVAVSADLRLYRFEATDDDTEFYVRAPSKSVALAILMERATMKKLKLQPRKMKAIDTETVR